MLETIRKDLESIRAELLRAFMAANENHIDARVQQLSRKFDSMLNLYMQAEKSRAKNVCGLERELRPQCRTASLQR